VVSRRNVGGNRAGARQVVADRVIRLCYGGDGLRRGNDDLEATRGQDAAGHSDVVEFGGVTDYAFGLIDAVVGVQKHHGLRQYPTHDRHQPGCGLSTIITAIFDLIDLISHSLALHSHQHELLFPLNISVLHPHPLR